MAMRYLFDALRDNYSYAPCWTVFEVVCAVLVWLILLGAAVMIWRVGLSWI